MNKYISSSERYEIINTTGGAVASGDVLISGNIVGIALRDLANNEKGAVLLKGVVTLGKTTALAISQGDRLYFNTSTKLITKTVTDVFIGTAVKAAAANTDTTVEVLLGESMVPVVKAANLAAIGTANGSDAATTQALANATKTAFNTLLTNLKNAGIMVAD